jgi:alanine dehydrogenase
MHKEAGERRDFLPGLVGFLDRLEAGAIILEEGYGSGMGIDPSEYLVRSARATRGSYEECLAQDVVMVLRCPADEALRRLRPGAVLLSMVHFPTRPERVKLLSELAVHAVSLDSIKDDEGRRLIENRRAVGWNGVRAAFAEIRKIRPHFAKPSRRPFRVTCLGAGGVGGYAVHAATRYGDVKLREELTTRNVPGVEVTVIDFDLTWQENYMLDRLEQTDLLIDATQRRDVSRPVVPNEWIAALPHDGTILDLAVDPYDFSVEPPKVKGIQGIPEGNLDQYVFHPNDPIYDRMDPRIPTEHRRVTLSCYSWPGLHPLECMERYSAQVAPVLRLIFDEPIGEWNPETGSFWERAVALAEVSRWRAGRAY